MKNLLFIVSLTAFIYGHTYGMDDTHFIDKSTREKLNQELKMAALHGEHEKFQRLIDAGAWVSSLDQTLIDSLKQRGYYAQKINPRLNPYYLILRIIKTHIPWIIGSPYCPPGGYSRLFHDPILDNDRLYE
jgi:hypothetical protein